MSHRSQVRESSPRATMDDKRSRRWNLQDLLEPSPDRDRMLVTRRRPVEHVTVNSDSKVVQRERGKLNQRAVSLPPIERKRDSRVSLDEGPRDKKKSPRVSFNQQDRNSRNKKKKPLPTATKFDTIYNCTNTKDVTVHLEFDVFNDLDDELEEFNALGRRGDFRSALTFFNDHLMSHISDPWIFVQYSEMLIAMGDYKSFHQLDPEPVFRQLHFSPRSDESKAAAMLELNWGLLRAVALSYSQHELQPILDDICHPQDIIPVQDNIGSTEVRIVCLAMRLMNFTTREEADIAAFPRKMADWGTWEMIYRELLAHGRIWDFRDLFMAAHTSFGAESAKQQFFGSKDALTTLLADWTTTEDDESTQLALLDIVAFMALGANSSSEVRPFAEQCLLAANPLGESIMEKFPQNVKSRSFLRWILTQASISARRGKRSPLAYDYLFDFPGEVILPKHIGIPYYIPIRQENPGWMPPDVPADSFEPLKMLLKASREFNDYETEALCLKELIVRSRDPSSLFDELASLQRDKQHNMEGYLTACLSRYLIARDSDVKAKLLAELNSFGWWQDPSNLVSPVRACTRDIMQQALSPTRPSYLPNSIKAGLRYYDSLPNFFQRLIDRHVESAPKPSQTYRVTRHHPGRPSLRHRRSASKERKGKKEEEEEIKGNETDEDMPENTKLPEPKRYDSYTMPKPAFERTNEDTNPRIVELSDAESLNNRPQSPDEDDYYHRPSRRRESLSSLSLYDFPRSRSHSPGIEEIKKIGAVAGEVLVTKAAEKIKEWREASPSSREQSRRRSRDSYSTRSRLRSSSRSRSRLRSRSRSASLHGKGSGLRALARAAAIAAAAAALHYNSAKKKKQDKHDLRSRSRSHRRQPSRGRSRTRSFERKDPAGEINATTSPTETKRPPERRLPPPLPPRAFTAKPVIEEVVESSDNKKEKKEKEAKAKSGTAEDAKDELTNFNEDIEEKRGNVEDEGTKKKEN